MFKIVAEFQVKPDKIEEFKNLTKELIFCSRAEAGCNSYDLYQDIACETTLTMLEEWKDQAAIDYHNSTPHFTTIIPQLGQYMTEDPKIVVYKKA